MGKRHTTPPLRFLDAAVFGQPSAVPETKDHSTGLEESNVVSEGGAWYPAEGL